MIEFLSDKGVQFTFTVLGAAVAWFVSQWQQRSRDEFLRREALYGELLRAMQGFYEAPTQQLQNSTAMIAPISQATQLKNEFINQYRLAWLFAPDPVILAVNTFFDAMHAQRETPASGREKEEALGKVVTEVRRNLFRPKFWLWNRTNLNSDSFRHVRAN